MRKSNMISVFKKKLLQMTMEAVVVLVGAATAAFGVVGIFCSLLFAEMGNSLELTSFLCFENFFNEYDPI